MVDSSFTPGTGDVERLARIPADLAAGVLVMTLFCVLLISIFCVVWGTR
jgi:hypothetical protein